MILCYDTANLDFQGGVPDDAEAILFYLDGHFRNEIAARKRFPHLFNTGRAIGLTVLQRSPAQGDDFEPGNAQGDAGNWAAESITRGVHRPILYMDGADWETRVRPSLERRFGRPLAPPGPGRRFRTIVANPDGNTDIPPEHDGKQYWWSSIQGSGQGDLDKSVLRDDFFGSRTPTPQIPSPQLPVGETAMAIATYKTAENRIGIAVETVKGEVLHIEQQNASGTPGQSGDWWREADGAAHWLSLGTPGQDDGPK